MPMPPCPPSLVRFAAVWVAGCCSPAFTYDKIWLVQVGYIGQISPTFVGDLAFTDGPSCPEVEMNDVTSDRWLSVDEIAAYLGVKRYTIYKWIERKNMPAHKVGSLWKFKRDEIDDWVCTGKSGDSNERRKPR